VSLIVVSAGEPCASAAVVNVSDSNSKQIIAIVNSANAGKSLPFTAKDLGISRFLLLGRTPLPRANKKAARSSGTLFMNCLIEF
jgi:hypothetical protein